MGVTALTSTARLRPHRTVVPDPRPHPRAQDLDTSIVFLDYGVYRAAVAVHQRACRAAPYRSIFRALPRRVVPVGWASSPQAVPGQAAVALVGKGGR